MRKMRVLMYCLLVFALSILGASGYWFYSTQSLRNEIIATLNSFSSFEYSEHELRGISQYKSKVIFANPTLKITTSSSPLLIHFDHLIFERNFRTNIVEVTNPTNTFVVSHLHNRFHCKNLDKATISTPTDQENGLTLSITQKAIECDLQDKKTIGSTGTLDLDFNLRHFKKSPTEKVTELILKALASTRKIETKLTFTDNFGTPAQYILELSHLNVSTPEHASNLAGKIYLSPSYTSIAKGNICLTTKNARAFLSAIETKLGLSENQKFQNFFFNIRSFVDLESDSLHVCIVDTNDKLTVTNKKTTKLLVEMF